MNSDNMPAEGARRAIVAMRRLITKLECLRLDVVEMRLQQSAAAGDSPEAEIAEAVLARAARR